jgi:aryl-alcohol dehydrogenase-like predicted oxidoreductase
MRYRQLAGTDLEVSELGVGCARLGGLFYKSTEAETIALLQSAFDSGVSFYDTADLYAQGESERLLGKAFAGCRDKVVIASKVGYSLPTQRRFVDRIKPVARPIVRRLRVLRRLSSDRVRGSLTQDFSPDAITAALEGSLARLQTDYLDLYMLHGVPEGNWDVTLESLERAKARGLVRYYGVSCASIEDAVLCLTRPQLSALQVGVSLLHPEGAALVADAPHRGFGIVARQCYASGLLSRPSAETDFRGQPADRLPRVQAFERLAEANERRLPELAFKFVNELPGVGVTLVGVRTQSHLDDAMAFLEARPLSDAERAALTALQVAG